MTLGEFHISGPASQRVAGNDGNQVSQPIVGLRGKFASNVPAGQGIPADGEYSYVPDRLFETGEDGLFYEIILDEHGSETVSDTPGITLTAADDEFENPLQWRYEPGRCIIGGRRIELASWTFDAPEPGWTGTLDELAPMPGIDLSSTRRGPRGPSGYDSRLSLLVTDVHAWVIDTDTYKYAENDGLTAAVSIDVTGDPVLGDKLWVALTGTASRAISHSTAFENNPNLPLPTTTFGTNRLDIGYIYNAATGKWRVMGIL